MDKLYLFLVMIFCHILDDFVLQGILSNMKQKDWWKENAPKELYKYDYIISLIIHSFSWTFMIMLPIAVYHKFDLSHMFYIVFILNICMHAYTDDAKCNKYYINLIVDQITHFIQIMFTFIVLIFNG